MNWILLVLLYGLLKGAREIAKKKAMDTNSVMEVLIAYTFFSFILVLPQIKNAGGVEPRFLIIIAVKSFAMFLAWICSFHSLKKIPVSLYGILSLSRVLFATLLGVLFLGESLGVYQIIGLILVCTGLILLKFKPFKKKTAQSEMSPELLPQETSASILFVILALISCLFNAISGFLDKILMKDVTSSQLQFWYMLFIVIYYFIYILIKKEKISISVVKNYWVWILAVMFVIGDKALFIANGISESKVTLMTLIKQSSCIVTIIGGKIFFKEKNIIYKLFCAVIVIIGIIIGLLK